MTRSQTFDTWGTRVTGWQFSLFKRSSFLYKGKTSDFLNLSGNSPFFIE